ncbi:2-oxo acid dehydrogenase subunit E2 [Fimbriiglobus ruber]|uniref:Dihydrolipoamide acetyltransferase component of pyruvate dehydrogenase complex n=1 Tax=Fimbriiglobus ruber TaxID=1908690 RepID=A0A225EAB3_9BACT|nr:2-oxo acid dehydrogenase subunit E2 [Fimbriiglobus ruber]OWK46329.1 Dihydrolipoamide acetyltransferase component of pyruvate dehydrogenase complex [Fimbriiglobus ruber]
MEFRLPALGDGIESATVVSVLVKPGDAVKAGQAVIGVETDKASMEVEADVDGTVEKVLVKPGDKIPIGGPVLKLSGAAAQPQAVTPPSSPPPPAAAAPQPSAPPKGGGKVEFKLPALGDGIEAATVVNVLVKPGDAVKAGQAVIGVETDKASMEVEADVDGTVEVVHVKPGDKVPVGALILTLTGGAAVKTSESSQTPAPAASSQPTAAPAPAPTPTRAVSTPQHTASSNGVATATLPATGTKTLVAAGPATRRLARELGVALGEVKGTARGGRVTLDNVKEFVRARMDQLKQGGGSNGGAGLSGKTVADSFTHPPLPDFAKYGPIEKQAVSGIRKKIAENLTVAWRMMPMVTQNDQADITDLEAGRKRIVDGLPKGAAKVTWTVLAVKAVVAVLKEFPRFNSSYDMNAGELILKKYYNVGIAVDTERGLVVPVIRDADKKTIRDVAAEVASLAEKARTNKLAIDEMRGATFTITNLGGIGGTSFTPIVNYPEVAILGLCRSSLQPVVKDNQIVPRLVLPLSLTYDHRVIDGADGARFAARLVQLFSDPIRLLMES